MVKPARPGRWRVVPIALLVPFIGWLIGTVLVFASRVWSRRDKLVGFALLLLPIVIFGLSFTAASGLNGGEESVPPGDTRPSARRRRPAGTRTWTC